MELLIGRLTAATDQDDCGTLSPNSSPSPIPIRRRATSATTSLCGAQRQVGSRRRRARQHEFAVGHIPGAINFREAALLLNVGPDDLVARDGRIALRGDPGRSLGFREAAMRMSVDRISAVASRSDDYGGFRRRSPEAAIADQDLGGVQFAEVAVDTETGIVRVERVVAAQDCGRPMNPLLLESQAQGGVIMGLSYALYEERLLDAATGRWSTPISNTTSSPACARRRRSR